MTGKRKVSIIFKIFIIACVLVGVLLQCGIGTSSFSLYSFRMFTTLSNCAVAIYFVCDVIAMAKDPSVITAGRPWKFLITMGISLTGLVAHFMLRGLFSDMSQEEQFGLTLLHYVVPICTVLDWILFDEKGKTTKQMPLFAACFPILYVIVTLLAAWLTNGKSGYPYPFLDVASLGAGRVAVNIVGLAIAYFAVGYLAVFLDHRLPQRNHHK